MAVSLASVNVTALLNVISALGFLDACELCLLIYCYYKKPTSRTPCKVRHGRRNGGVSACRDNAAKLVDYKTDLAGRIVTVMI